MATFLLLIGYSRFNCIPLLCMHLQKWKTQLTLRPCSHHPLNECLVGAFSKTGRPSSEIPRIHFHLKQIVPIMKTMQSGMIALLLFCGFVSGLRSALTGSAFAMTATSLVTTLSLALVSDL